jgi:predicted O-methyltransferase YrrM
MSNILLPSQLKYLNQFRNEDDPLIFEIEQYAKEHKVPVLNWQAADFMEQIIRIINPKRVLEIGTAIAYSSIRIARNLRKKAVVHTIEMSEETAEVAKEFINRSGFGDKIVIKTGNALTIMPQLQKKYDFIFLDADKEDYKRLFDYSMILLKKDGVIFIDNLLWHGFAANKKVPKDYKISTNYIREFNKIFMNQPSLKSIIIPVGDGIGLGVKQ